MGGASPPAPRPGSISEHYRGLTRTNQKAGTRIESASWTNKPRRITALLKLG
jgi:hypothetical protein